METPKIIWLKNVKNGLIYPINSAELSIYQQDKTEVVIATESEVEAYQNGTHWGEFNAPKTETKTSKETPPKTETK
jgi:hypothetical protein